MARSDRRGGGAWSYRDDPALAAARLGISQDAMTLYLASDVIDLHVDSFLWPRIFGYDLNRRHGTGPFGGRLLGQVDLPRIHEACVTGATWSIDTNPLRRRSHRPEALARNIAHLTSVLTQRPERFAVVKSHAEYRAARDAGKHGAFLGIQGGNAVDRDLDAVSELDPRILRVTLVHLSSSRIGTTSAPGPRRGPSCGLSDFGRGYVERLNARRVFVDLAHIHREAFFDAVAVHDRSQPLVITHTGVAGVFPCWRNVDDAQLRAVADTGGVIGVMYHGYFLGDAWLGGRAERIVDHLAHIVTTVGEDHAALGSDWDGLINPPRDMVSCLELPRLVQRMLDRGWSETRIQKILGGNFLRALRDLRG